MFRVIDFVALIRLVAIGTTLLTLFFYAIIEHQFPQFLTRVHPFTLAPSIALVLMFLLTSKWISRQIWKIARYVNGSLYPDLNGVWEGEISFENNGNDVTLPARAVIRQFLLKTEIDMYTSTAKSSTLEATPAVNSGQFKLYYIYGAKPKRAGYGTYTGSTIFDIRMVKDGAEEKYELSGYYYTDRGTMGRTRLRHVNNQKDIDVSFY